MRQRRPLACGATGWDGATASVPDTKGMRDIATLLASVGREVHVLDLVEAAGGPPAAGAGQGAGPRLDRAARAAYRRRLADLADDLAEAESRDDAARIDALRDEHEQMVMQPAGALGLHGRPRADADPAERARKAVADVSAVSTWKRSPPLLHGSSFPRSRRRDLRRTRHGWQASRRLANAILGNKWISTG